jgi:hypothetical protein
VAPAPTEAAELSGAIDAAALSTLMGGDGELAMLLLRDFVTASDHAEQRLGRPCGDLHQRALIGIEPAVFEHVQGAGDGDQRRAQLVTGHRQERRLRPVGGGRRLLGQAPCGEVALDRLGHLVEIGGEVTKLGDAVGRRALRPVAAGDPPGDRRQAVKRTGDHPRGEGERGEQRRGQQHEHHGLQHEQRRRPRLQRRFTRLRVIVDEVGEVDDRRHDHALLREVAGVDELAAVQLKPAEDRVAGITCAPDRRSDAGHHPLLEPREPVRRIQRRMQGGGRAGRGPAARHDAGPRRGHPVAAGGTDGRDRP